MVADVHEGIGFGYRINPETGISDRALDLHNNLRLAAQWAINHGAKLFIIAGDLFERTHVSPAFRELVRRDVVEPLSAAGVMTWLVAGNHDQPRIAARSTSLDDYRGLPLVEVFKDPVAKTMDLGEGPVGFIILPYLHPERLLDLVREKLGEEVPPEQMDELARRLLREWLRNRSAELKTQRKFLIGHYLIQGAKVSSTVNPEVVPGEFSLTKDLIPEDVDLTLLGHIHLHQSLGPKIVYIGAPERIDWGERGDPKGFLSLEPSSARWTFHPLPAREMVALEVDATGENPTEAILRALPADLKNKMLRLDVHLRPGGRKLVEEAALDRRLAEAFHVSLRWHEEEEARFGVSEATLAPVALFEDFVANNYAKDPRKKALLEEGRKILQEVLS